MRRKSIWSVIGNGNKRSSQRRDHRSREKHGTDDKGLWDTVLFQPQKSDNLSIWRGLYKMERQLKELERGLSQPSYDSPWWRFLKVQWMSVWGDLVDEVKALLTVLFFHIVTLVLVVVCNLIWFALLLWAIGVWLEG